MRVRCVYTSRTRARTHVRTEVQSTVLTGYNIIELHPHWGAIVCVITGIAGGHKYHSPLAPQITPYVQHNCFKSSELLHVARLRVET